MEIEFDPAKDEANLAKHGISLARAVDFEIIAFREDESRIRKDHAPENFAILRHMALNLLRKESSVKSIKRKRLRAGWDNDYLVKILHA